MAWVRLIRGTNKTSEYQLVVRAREVLRNFMNGWDLQKHCLDQETDKAYDYQLVGAKGMAANCIQTGC